MTFHVELVAMKKFTAIFHAHAGSNFYGCVREIKEWLALRNSTHKLLTGESMNAEFEFQGELLTVYEDTDAQELYAKLRRLQKGEKE